jgi:hypothetical protein
MLADLLHHARFDEPRLAYDATKEPRHGALVEWSGIGLADAAYDLTLARAVAERQASGPLRFPDLDGESRAPVEEAQQLRVNRINFFSPLLNTHLPGFLLKIICRTHTLSPRSVERHARHLGQRKSQP